MEMMTRTLLLLMVFATGALEAGCGRTDVTMDRKVALPAAFPEDLPLPDRARLRISMELDARRMNLVFETRDGVAEAVALQKARLSDAGWRLLAEAAVEDGVFLSYRKGERSLAVGASRAGSETLVSLTYVAQPGGLAGGNQG